MPTILFDSTIFGPVRSRRLGVSLGVNLLPVDRKLCSFDCVYCECGLNASSRRAAPAAMPTRAEVAALLRERLLDMARTGVRPDVITFAGNGEPTLHADFASIIADTLEIRGSLCPQARVAVLSNATQLDRPDVVEALRMVDDNILKLDSGLTSTVLRLDRPQAAYGVERVVEQMRQFAGRLTVQTMFVRGTIGGEPFDNTSAPDVDAWLRCLDTLRPQGLMVYTIARATPLPTLVKVSRPELEALAAKAAPLVGSVSVSD